jgi:hypothetical protein
VDRVLDRFERAHVAPGQDHMRACGRQSPGSGRADALARSGDERGAAFERPFVFDRRHQATFPTGRDNWR